MLRNISEAHLRTAVHHTHQKVTTVRLSLAQLAANDTLADGSSLEAFQEQTGLTDLFWQAMYYQFPDYDQGLAEALLTVDGYVFFLHGWTGSHRIWENLPIRLTGKHKNIVCFNFDVNGFGQSTFIKEIPAADQCSPPAIMRSIEYWLTVTGLWPPPANRRRNPFYLFIGHSMSGAALFYKNVADWQDETYGFYALAPALFHNSAQRKAFFKTVGVSIGLPSFSAVKDALAPRVIDILGAGASPEVKNEHLRIYNQTPFGALAQTLYMLGAASEPPSRSDWGRFRVGLGHKDRIVGLEGVLNLLEQFNFSPAQIRLTLGDHYFFSHGEGSPETHKHNREVVFQDLVDFCYQLTKEARRR